MPDESIIVELNSNVVNESNKSYKIGNFKNRLSEILYLSEEWEVALTEISYTKTWYNILEDQKCYLLDSNKNIFQMEEKIEIGNYETEEIIENINEIYEMFSYKVPGITYPPQLFYNKQTNRVSIKLGLTSTNNHLFPQFDNFLANLLGLIDNNGRQFPNNDDKPLIKTEIILVNNFQSESQIKTNSQENTTQQTNPNTTVTNTSENLPKNQIPNENKQKPNLVSEPSKTPIKKVNENKNLPNPASETQGILENSTPWWENIENNKNFRPQTTPSTNQKPIYIYESDNVTNPRTDVIKTYTSVAKNKRALEENSFKKLRQSSFFYGYNSVTLFGTIKSLFVYTDIIRPNLVGNAQVPLIRRVKIPSEVNFGHQVEIIYTRPEYFSLVTHEISEIEIAIKDDTNRLIEFAFGKVYLKLHFRKKENVKSLYDLL